MKIKPKRFILAILAGFLVGALFLVFFQPKGLGPIAALLVSVFISKVESPKQGALVGTILYIPLGVVVVFIANMQSRTIESLGLIKAIPYILLAFIFVVGFGALLGLIIGKIFQIINRRSVIL